MTESNKRRPGGKSVPQPRAKGTPYMTKDGEPNRSTGASPGYHRLKHPEHNFLPAVETTGSNPAIQILEEIGRPFETASFDPFNPESVYHDRARKFTVAKKMEFLNHVVRHGNISFAATRVGITPSGVIKHRKKDAVFDELVIQAVEMYANNTVEVIKHIALAGSLEEKWKDGQLIFRRVAYQPRLLEMLLKQYAPEFRETQKIDVSVQGGAVLIPTPAQSLDDWASIVSALATAGGTLGDSGPLVPAGASLGDGAVLANGQPLKALGEGLPGDGSGDSTSGVGAALSAENATDADDDPDDLM